MPSLLRIPRIFQQRLRLSRAPCAKVRDRSHRWRKLIFELSGYNRYGLYTDDLLDADVSHVREALRRLPKDVLDARNYRAIRAMQLDMLKIQLPKEEWVTFEEDLENRYLRPYVNEVLAEWREIYDFGCVNYSEEDWPAREVR